jgi:predicted phosphodiesterase
MKRKSKKKTFQNRVKKFFRTINREKVLLISSIITSLLSIGMLITAYAVDRESVNHFTENVISQVEDGIGKTWLPFNNNDNRIPETGESLPSATTTTNPGSSQESSDSSSITSTSTTTSTSTSTSVTTTTTLPESPSAVVAFYADSQSDTDQEDVIHQKTVNYILSSGANPVFHAGDVMEDGTQNSLDRFNSVTATLRSSRIFYACLGNNDRKIGDSSTPSQLFLDNFVFPNNERWYSVNYGNLHMVILDSAFAAGSPTQLSWLANDLQSSASQSRITGVMFHHPTFSSTITQQLIDYGVDFVISGHNHSYQHSTSNGIHYFVMSGQTSLGYTVVRVYSNRVTVTAFNQNSAVIDYVEFNER